MVNTGKENSSRESAMLALADGTVFRGYSVGATGVTSGEVVFNTSLSGYQEILTDPSYANQMLTFTYPHIGNVGVNAEDVESNRVQVAGFIARDLSPHYSNYRATSSLGEYLVANNVVGIAGIDTRALVLHLRNNGAQMGVIQGGGEPRAARLVEKAEALSGLEGMDLVARVSTDTPYTWREGVWRLGSGVRHHTEDELHGRPHLVAIDFGVKYSILRLFIEHGFRVTVVPAETSAGEILALEPDAVFLSNGPGDPAPVTYGVKAVKELLGKKPIFGICLGHQILGLALGAKTYKLKFGHRGGNHPVRDEVTGKVEITVQNHGFATHREGIPSQALLSHVNLNDQTVEGFRVPDAQAFSVQYHPESSPGPHDARYLFKRFREMVEVRGESNA